MAFKELAQRRNLWFKIFLGLTAAELQGNKKKGKEKKKNKSINNMHIDKLPEQWKKSISGRSSTFNTDVAKIIK